jgi:hypothetical protein
LRCNKFTKFGGTEKKTDKCDKFGVRLFSEKARNYQVPTGTTWCVESSSTVSAFRLKNIIALVMPI